MIEVGSRVKWFKRMGTTKWTPVDAVVTLICKSKEVVRIEFEEGGKRISKRVKIDNVELR